MSCTHPLYQGHLRPERRISRCLSSHPFLQLSHLPCLAFAPSFFLFPAATPSPPSASFSAMATSGSSGSSSASAPQPQPVPSNSDQTTWDGDEMSASLLSLSFTLPTSPVPSSHLACIPLPHAGLTYSSWTIAKSEDITRLLASLSRRPTFLQNLNLPSTLSKVYYSSPSLFRCLSPDVAPDPDPC